MRKWEMEIDKLAKKGETEKHLLRLLFAIPASMSLSSAALKGRLKQERKAKTKTKARKASLTELRQDAFWRSAVCVLVSVLFP